MRAVVVRLSGGGGGAVVRPLANDKDNTCRGCFASPGLIIFVPDDNFLLSCAVAAGVARLSWVVAVNWGVSVCRKSSFL